MGPLQGIKIVEFGSIGPGPFACMVMADLGADIIRLARAGDTGPLTAAPTPDRTGRPAVEVNLKDADDIAFVKELIAKADACVEGFRPGVMERLGLGPDVLLEVNPRLVYGRMTGYGQDGPLASVAGHDINYCSIAGTLGAIQRDGEKPMFPLNLLGDYGGGGMFMVIGVLAGVLEARSSGQGQVIDVAMVDGVAALSTIFYGMRSMGVWKDEPGTNILDSGAHFYEVYECSDGGYISVGAIEPQFYAAFLGLMEIDQDDMPQYSQERWPEFKATLEAKFKTKTRDEWAAILEPAEACSTPVLGFAEAASHPHNAARGMFGEDGMPVPAPRFSRTPAAKTVDVPSAEEAVAAWGVSR